MPDNDKKIDDLTVQFKKRIKNLTNLVHVGKLTIIIEVNVSQGAIGDSYITGQTKEKA